MPYLITKDLHVLLLGSGKMAKEYAQVLRALNIPYQVVGRGTKSAQLFYKETGTPVWTSGLDLWWDSIQNPPSLAIIAVNVESLAETTKSLINNGVKKILVEKPGALYPHELEEISSLAEGYGTQVYVAYNRRFYSSTLAARDMIERDGGVTSFHFDFTEWSDRISTSSISNEVKKYWFLANSTHVADLAFYLGGEPSILHPHVSGALTWHPAASVFVGSGNTCNGAMFSYHANWSSFGNWGVELYTPKHKLVLKPLEKLYVQKIGEAALYEVVIDRTEDIKYKPGLYQQMIAVLNNDPRLITIHEQWKRTKQIYLKIVPYPFTKY